MQFSICNRPFPAFAAFTLLAIVSAATAAQEGRVTRTRLVGRADAATFTDESPARVPLVGLKLRVAQMDKDDCIQTLLPVYFGNVMGRTQGKVIEAAEIDLVAKPGYAVAGVNTRSKTGDRLVAVQLLFMKLAAGRLDPADSYSSDWVGGKGDGREVMLGNDGKLIIGLVGRSSPKPPEKGIVSNLGLIQLELPGTTPPPTPTPAPVPSPAPPVAAASPPPRSLPGAMTGPKSPAARRLPGASKIETASTDGSNKLFEALRAPEEMREKAPTAAHAAGWTDLLATLDAASQSTRGTWRREAGLLTTVAGAEGAVIGVPGAPAPGEGYQLLARVERRGAADDGSIALTVPVESRQVSIVFDAQSGAGLAPLQGQPADRNGTIVPAALLKPAAPHDIFIRVTPGAEEATIEVAMDGKFLIRWTGPLDHLEPGAAATPADPRLRVTATNTTATIHQLRAKGGP